MQVFVFFYVERFEDYASAFCLKEVLLDYTNLSKSNQHMSL